MKSFICEQEGVQFYPKKIKNRRKIPFVSKKLEKNGKGGPRHHSSSCRHAKWNRRHNWVTYTHFGWPWRWMKQKLHMTDINQAEDKFHPLKRISVGSCYFSINHSKDSLSLQAEAAAASWRGNHFKENAHTETELIYWFCEEWEHCTNASALAVGLGKFPKA